MMRVLIIEDSNTKAKECISALTSFDAECVVVSNEKDAKIEIKNRVDYDLIVLDMELDLSTNPSEGKGCYSGLAILNTMKYNSINTPVIVVTVYRDFSKMKTTSDTNSLLSLFSNWYFKGSRPLLQNFDPSTLEGLHYFMSFRYTNYVGVVEYSIYNSIWKKRLQEMIFRCMEKENYEGISG